MIINIVIDANIGAGKTTLLKLLQKNLVNTDSIVYNFFEENVESWMNEGWLEKYYSNIPKYASSFQTRVLLSHIQQRKKIMELNSSQTQEVIVNICGVLFNKPSLAITVTPNCPSCIGVHVISPLLFILIPFGPAR